MPIALLNEAVTDRQVSWEWTDDGIARNRLQNPGYTALMVAAVLAPRYVQVLLDRCAEPHLRDGAGCTALMLACSHQPPAVHLVRGAREFNVPHGEPLGSAPSV